jgi:dipeptidyl aminopeptidase/acylaminoacyl peptidase
MRSFLIALLTRALLLTAGACLTAPALAQEKLSAAADRDKLFRQYLGSAALVRGGRVTPHWLADGRRFWYATEAKDGTLFHLVDPRSNTKRPLLDADRLRRALKERSGRDVPGDGLPFRTVDFVDDEARVRFTFADRPWLLTLADYALAEAPAAPGKPPDAPRLVRKGTLEGEAPVLEVAAPGGRQFATERDHNLVLRAAGADAVTPLTTDGRKDYAWSVGKAQWSPDGTKLAAFKVDTREVPRYPVVRWLPPTPEVDFIPMTRPGGTLPRQELFVVDAASRQVTRVDAGPAEQSLALVRWLPDGSELLFVRVDRRYQKLELCAADSRTGAARVLVTETQKTFVRTPLLADYTLPLVGKGKEFLWLSERTGWNHIYLYDLRGRQLRALTRGEFPVERILDVDESGGWVYFTAHDDRRRPYDTHVCRVNLQGEGFARLTEAEGQHDFPAYLTALLQGAPAGTRFSPSKEYFLDTHSSPDRPPRTELRRADGRLLRVLEEADVSALRQLSWKPPEPFVVQAADGRTELHGLLYKPSDFDPAKKYPVLDYIYNGPQTVWVERTFNGPLGQLPQAFAQLGYVVLVVDGRGTPERGKAFQDVVYGHFGRDEVPDHVAALEQLAGGRPYMDRARVGVFGGSFGGYMTVRAMLTAPEVYRVGVATAPVYDMADLPSFIEMYMGRPEDNPKGYEEASCSRLASKLKGKLLIIHGSRDVNAPFAATMRMLSAFIAAGKAVDLQVLPDETHAPRGSNGAYALDATRRYLAEHLRP